MQDIDNIYYNITINHEDNPKGLARFEENRTESILPKCSDYYVTVQRFYVPMSLIPIMIADIQENQANPNLMTYSVGLQYIGVYARQYLTFVPDSLNVSVPPPPSANPNGKQSKSEYYFIHSIQSLLNMFNTAFINTLPLVGAPVGSEPPYVIYDQTTNLFSIICQTAFYDNSLPNPISIYFNNAASPLFLGMPMYTLPNSGANGKDYQVIVQNTYDNFYNPPYLAPTIPPAYYKITQNYNSLSNWNSMLSIVFTSNTIPIRGEQIPASRGSGDANFRNIITDFQPLFTQNGLLRDAAQYFPQGPYRLIDLTSTTELRKFDLQVYWQDKNGFLYNVYVAPNETLNVKLLFIKKDLYKTSKK